MAVTLEFGKCPTCNENNSKTLQFCRACGAALPWSKSVKNPSASNPRTSPSQSSSTPSKTKIGLGDLAYGAMAVQLTGGLIFLGGIVLWLGNVLNFLPTFPGVGYITMLIGGAIWKGGQNME